MKLNESSSSDKVAVWVKQNYQQQNYPQQQNNDQNNHRVSSNNTGYYYDYKHGHIDGKDIKNVVCHSYNDDCKINTSRFRTNKNSKNCDVNGFATAECEFF